MVKVKFTLERQMDGQQGWFARGIIKPIGIWLISIWVWYQENYPHVNGLTNIFVKFIDMFTVSKLHIGVPTIKPLLKLRIIFMRIKFTEVQTVPRPKCKNIHRSTELDLLLYQSEKSLIINLLANQQQFTPSLTTRLTTNHQQSPLTNH